MKSLNKNIITLIAFAFFTISAVAQTSDDVLNLLVNKGTITQAEADSIRADNAIKEQEAPKDKSFTIGGEIRTRTEYRNGYRQIPTDTSKPAFFTNQRTRLSFTYEQKNKFKLHTSFQDVRVWGATDPRSNNATVQLYEAYGEFFLHPKFSIKLGQQVIALDDQRLFAENDWRVNGQTHDAASFHYNADKLQTSLFFAFNQTSSNNGYVNQPYGEPIFGTQYSPGAGVSTYKSLGVHYLKYNITERWALTTINSADGWQKPSGLHGVYQRLTDGGRIAYQNGGFYGTFSGYYQSGQDATGNKLNAFYLQGELKYAVPDNYSIRLGAEVFSGNNGKVKTSLDENFSPLYGVAHRFNGNMDLFISFPSDLNNAGLVNPYLFFTKNAGQKVVFRADFHTFYSENNYVNTVKVGKTTTSSVIGKYLGYENDLGVVYKPKSYITIDVGFSYAIVDKSMVVIKKSGNPDFTPTWAYISVSIKPQLFKAVFK